MAKTSPDRSTHIFFLSVALVLGLAAAIIGVMLLITTDSSSPAQAGDAPPTLFAFPTLTATLVGPTHNPTWTPSPTATGTRTPTAAISATPSLTPTHTPTPTPAPTLTLRPSITPTFTPSITPTPRISPTPSRDRILPGFFELGGQTHTLDHANHMHYAGMTWVKFQHKWNETDNPPHALRGRIEQAHKQGFKVLLSVTGPEYPASIDYNAYARYLTGVAAQEPDAIEVWNEMNTHREWPYNQIDGGTYVKKMLAPAYEAIKVISPEVMVISGAPAPTGYWQGCAAEGCDDAVFIEQMRQAGAANYVDCIGVHFNNGATSPHKTSGHPAGDHYTWYYQTMLDKYYNTFKKPLCFTELGYLSREGYGPLPPDWTWATGNSVAEQAQWLADSAILASWSGKVRLMIVFSIDIYDWGNDPQSGYAIVRPDGSCPACIALREAWP